MSNDVNNNIRSSSSKDLIDIEMKEGNELKQASTSLPKKREFSSPQPIASTSKLPKLSSSTTESTSNSISSTSKEFDSKPTSSKSLVKSKPKIETIVIADTTSEEENSERPLSKKLKTTSSGSSSRSTSTLPTSKTSKGSPASSSVTSTKKSKIKPPLTLEKALEKSNKLKPNAFFSLYPTISTYIDYLNSHSIERKLSKTFKNKRICYINPLSNKNNSMDSIDLKLNLNLIQLNDGILIKPENFKASPVGYELLENWEERSELEGWTNYIIVNQWYPHVPIEFNSVIPCLPNLTPSSSSTPSSFSTSHPKIFPTPTQEAITNLGSFVQILSFSWASRSLQRHSILKPTPSEEAIEDLRTKQNEVQLRRELNQKRIDESREKFVEEKRIERVKKLEGGGGGSGSKGKGRQEESDGSSVDEGDDEEEEEDDVEEIEGEIKKIRRRAKDFVSPFGSQDYPTDEEPDHSTSKPTSSTDKGKGKAKLPSEDLLPSNNEDESIYEELEEEIEDSGYQSDTTKNLESNNNRPSSPSAYSNFKGLSNFLAKTATLLKENDDEFGPLESSASSLEEREEEEDGKKIDESVNNMMEIDKDIIYGDNDDFGTDEERDEMIKNDERKKILRKEGNVGQEEEIEIRQPYKRHYACEDESTGGATKTGLNEMVAQKLDELSKAVKGDTWRESGYRKAAGVLRNQKKEIRTYEQAIALKNVGDSIAKKIVEIVKSGQLRRLNVQLPKTKSVELFSKIYGVGPKIAEDIYASGARTLKDLELSGSKFKLTDSQKLGLKYYDDLQKRIPRDEVTKLWEIAVKCAKEIDPKLEVYCMGSYRRGQPDCGDIDLMVTRDTSDGRTHQGLIYKLWERLLAPDGIIRYGLNSPEDWKSLDAKFNGLCCLPDDDNDDTVHLMRRIDIFGVPRDELPAALIAFTGNDFFNRSMRLKARHMGYRLNQKALYKHVMRGAKAEKITQGVRVDCKTEEDIFKKLEVPYRPPNQRLP